ncbi:MAG: hypothetical protein HQM08_11670 [Candidatus Riflebacteria bacterium]|nr:hypothetical protein [Candidatus Riflebacteria bacterium]
MKIRNFSKNLELFILVLVLIFSFTHGEAIACDLPAEPAAGAVPPSTENFSIHNSSYLQYYFLPSGSPLRLNILWDPYCHGYHGEHNYSKYMGVSQKYSRLPNYYFLDGYGFFSPYSMIDFFHATGNRNDQAEAVGRALGHLAGFPYEYYPTSDDPETVYWTAFVSAPAERQAPITDLRIDIYGNQHAGAYSNESLLYPYSTQFEDTSGTPYNGANALGGLPTSHPRLNDILPNPESPKSPQDIISGGRRRQVHFIDAALYLNGSFQIGVSNPGIESYEAFVYPDSHYPTEPPAKVRANLTVVDRANGGYNLDMPVPNTGGDRIYAGVHCPGSGYEAKNGFWAWREEVHEWVASSNPSIPWVNPFNSRSTFPNVYISNCSVRTDVIMTKGSTAEGLLGFYAYDSKPPVSSKFELTGPMPVGGQPVVNVPFKVTFVDNHPYGDKPFEATFSGGGETYVAGNRLPSNYEQKMDNVKNNLAIYYYYPTMNSFKYSFDKIEDLAALPPLENLVYKDQSHRQPNAGGVGGFEVTYLKPDWSWKKASIDQASLNIQTQIIQVEGKDEGMLWTVTGKMSFDSSAQAAPAYFATNKADGTALDADKQIYSVSFPSSGLTNFPHEGITSSFGNIFKIYAVFSDSAGNLCTNYNELSAKLNRKDSNPTEEVLGYDNGSAFVPVKTDASYNANLVAQADSLITPSTRDGTSNNFFLQKYSYFPIKDGVNDTSLPETEKDKNRPRIQVIVCDTRNNRYHLLGSEIPDSQSYRYEYYSENDWQNLYKIFFNDPNGAAQLMEKYDPGNPLKKPAFVSQPQSRFMFYIRAWDNLMTFKQPHQGINKINVEIKDFSATQTELDQAVSAWANLSPFDYTKTINSPVVWQFREANTEPNGSGGYREIAGKECSLTVKAEDFTGNSQTMFVKFVILSTGNIDIRTLEEKRQGTR